MLPGHQVPALLGKDGQFKSDRQIKWAFKPGTARQLHVELGAQIERFIQDVGTLPDHLDNHCSISYVRPDYFKVTLDLAQEYKLPIRAPFGDDLEDNGATHGKAEQLPSLADPLVREILPPQGGSRWHPPPQYLHPAFFKLRQPDT